MLYSGFLNHFWRTSALVCLWYNFKETYDYYVISF